MAKNLNHAMWLKDMLAGLTAASGIGYLATAYTVSRWLTRTSRYRLSSPVSITGHINWQNIECETSDGVRLVGWVAEPARPRATVALFHGLRGNRGRTLNRIAFLTEAGYRCVAFDHRAHGQSRGNHTSFGYYEGRDVLAVLDVIRQRWPHEPRAALGISMGAAALCFAGPQAKGFQALILESLYDNLERAFRSRVGSHFPHWFSHFMEGVIWLTEKRLKVRLDQLAPVKFITQLSPAPILLVTGADDPYARPEEVQGLFQNCGGPREMHVVPDAGHDNVCEKGGDRYRGLILDFLGRKLAA